ncbi:MAG: polysaccharide deacetylase family protein [Candidatus Dormibacteria bacterium]
MPILTYHYIRQNPQSPGGDGWELSVAPDEFARQMAYLRIAGAHAVTLADVMRALRGGPALPARPVLLTFDDGYADFATAAAPVLERNGLVGTDFVVGGFIGRPNYMTAEQILDVAAHGMVIGAHTMHHVKLNTIPIDLARAEINDSKRTLELLLGRPVDDFAYPYGSYDPEVVGLVAAAGFRDAVTTNPGNVQFLSARLELRRTRVGASDTMTSFARKALLPPPPPERASPPASPQSAPSPKTTPGPTRTASAAPASPTPTGRATVIIPVAGPTPKP